METFKATGYELQTIASGRVFKDSGWVIDDPEEKSPSLIRALYAKKQLEPKDAGFGIYRFADWLPIKRMLQGSCAPVTYKSEKLAQKLG
ncbi:MAG: cysteate synthase, partial [Bacteroidales bacterium]|nr:cysteate synthase [Bacteroidales bacterium]